MHAKQLRVSLTTAFFTALLILFANLGSLLALLFRSPLIPSTRAGPTSRTT